VKPICVKQDWREAKLSALNSIAKVSGLTAPRVDQKKIFKALEIEPLSFL
jgi:hypothetical protein